MRTRVRPPFQASKRPFLPERRAVLEPCARLHSDRPRRLSPGLCRAHTGGSTQSLSSSSRQTLPGQSALPRVPCYLQEKIVPGLPIGKKLCRASPSSLFLRNRKSMPIPYDLDRPLAELPEPSVLPLDGVMLSAWKPNHTAPTKLLGRGSFVGIQEFCGCLNYPWKFWRVVIHYH